MINVANSNDNSNDNNGAQKNEFRRPMLLQGSTNQAYPSFFLPSKKTEFQKKNYFFGIGTET